MADGVLLPVVSPPRRAVAVRNLSACGAMTYPGATLVAQVPRFAPNRYRPIARACAGSFGSGQRNQSHGAHGWPGPAYADPGARIECRARGRAEAPSMAPQPLLDVLSRTPCARHPIRPPAKGTRTGSLLGSIAACSTGADVGAIARHPWRNVSESRTPARTSMSGRSSRCDFPLASQSLLTPLHPRRSSACAQGVAGHGWPAKACHDTDVVSGRPRAQALRRGPARQGRRGCGVPSLWFLSLGKQRKEPAPGEIIRPELLASQVRNPSACGEWVSQLRRLLRATKQSVLPHGGLHHA